MRVNGGAALASKPARPWFVRTTQQLRVLGWIICAMLLWLCLAPRSPPLWQLALALAWAGLWPLLAYWHSRNTRHARQAGYRYLLVDAFGFGGYSVLLAFSIMPTTTLIYFMVFSCMALGGLRLALRGLLAYAAGIALAWPLFGLQFVPHVSALTAWLCLLCIPAYTLPGIALFLKGNRRLIGLRQFLPPAVAHLVMNQGREEVLRARRTEVTVCCFDLRGFTAYAESAEPAALMAMLQDYYQLVGEAVERHGGTVERFAGDGMVAFFNAPAALQAPQHNAVQACLAIQQDYQQLRARWPQQAGVLGLGIGIASGPATVGAVGFAEQWQYAAIGPATNLSARLCAMAADGELLAEAGCVASLTGVRADSRGLQVIRGFSEPVEVVCLS